ncbi:hypothetical protein MITS9508_01121 [Synechococcus sp. MIT S9508]|nr:hypothetical protein MITS9508_01121 [Synechococcus sp. MIT S9508]
MLRRLSVSTAATHAVLAGGCASRSALDTRRAVKGRLHRFLRMAKQQKPAPKWLVWENYPNVLNYVIAILFIAFAVVAFVPNGVDWSFIPFLVLMAFIFIKRGIDKKAWELGDKLVMPVLCFTFVVGFIDGLMTNVSASTLWYNGGLVALCVSLSINELCLKSRPSALKGELDR